MMNLFSLLRARRKRNIIRKYITHLGPLLASRYGKAEHYSPAQVHQTIAENGLNGDEAVYALVIYCTPEMFAAHQAAHGGTARYWELRVEIMGYNFRHKRKWEAVYLNQDLSSADYDAYSGFSDIH